MRVGFLPACNCEISDNGRVGPDFDMAAVWPIVRLGQVRPKANCRFFDEIIRQIVQSVFPWVACPQNKSRGVLVHQYHHLFGMRRYDPTLNRRRR